MDTIQLLVHYGAELCLQTTNWAGLPWIWLKNTDSTMWQSAYGTVKFPPEQSIFVPSPPEEAKTQRPHKKKKTLAQSITLRHRKVSFCPSKLPTPRITMAKTPSASGSVRSVHRSHPDRPIAGCSPRPNSALREIRSNRIETTLTPCRQQFPWRRIYKSKAHNGALSVSLSQQKQQQNGVRLVATVSRAERSKRKLFDPQRNKLVMSSFSNPSGNYSTVWPRG